MEIEKIVSGIKNKSSSGNDGISNRLVKELCPVISMPLSIVFNTSLQTGTFLSRMKGADVSPLNKSKSKLEKGNYRPISLLITMSKILEKIVYKRTYTFLEKMNQLYNSQYRFRAKHSCEQAVSELLSQIVKGHKQNKLTVAIFLDLSKAFDTLSHDVLLNKLYKYGIRGTTLDWFKSYLTERTLQVKCHTDDNGTITYSRNYKIDIGTPQGSCLGPLLFIIFTNDLHRNLVYTNCILFTDDTTIYYTHENLRYLQWCLEEDLKIIADWFKANQLTLNIGKSVCMVFSRGKMQKLSGPLSIKIENLSLPVVTSFKFLGIWLDKDLNWNVHVNKLITKIKQNLHMLRQGKNFLNQHAKKILYYAQIYSHLSYGIITWGNMIDNTKLVKLNKLHEKAIKLVGLPLLRFREILKLQNLKLGHRIRNP